jgi:hypothetical protein
MKALGFLGSVGVLFSASMAFADGPPQAPQACQDVASKATVAELAAHSPDYQQIQNPSFVLQRVDTLGDGVPQQIMADGVGYAFGVSFAVLDANQNQVFQGECFPEVKPDCSGLLSSYVGCALW